MTRELEIRKQMEILANAGLEATERQDMEQCIHLARELVKLSKELATITGDSDWDDLAKEGNDLADGAETAQTMIDALFQ